MITQATPFTTTQLASLLAAYFDGAALSGAATVCGKGITSVSKPDTIQKVARNTLQLFDLLWPEIQARMPKA